MRRWSSLVCLIFLGCQSLGPTEMASVASILPSPPRSRDPLLREASQALERGDPHTACECLRQYADCHPDSKPARIFYAEVLTKLDKSSEAAIQFERAIAALQEDKTVDLGHIVYCHGRLLDLADANGDEYRIHLHRGLGLYWLAQQPRTEESPESFEGVLFKAAMEFMAAHELNPEEARPMWYLHLIWRQLGQSGPAERWLRQANAAEATSSLTPQERGDLQLRIGLR